MEETVPFPPINHPVLPSLTDLCDCTGGHADIPHVLGATECPAEDQGERGTALQEQVLH